MKSFQTFLLEYTFQGTIYCDMDGVLAGFEHGIRNSIGLKPGDGDLILKGKLKLDWGHVAQTKPDFWEKLPWQPGGDVLWSYISKYRPHVLTKTPSEWPGAGILEVQKQKMKWCKVHLGKTFRDITFVPYHSDKGKVVKPGPSDILIDDLDKNITGWKAAGGIGIKFINAEQVIKELEAYGL